MESYISEQGFFAQLRSRKSIVYCFRSVDMNCSGSRCSLGIVIFLLGIFGSLFFHITAKTRDFYHKTCIPAAEYRLKLATQPRGSSLGYWILSDSRNSASARGRLKLGIRGVFQVTVVYASRKRFQSLVTSPLFWWQQDRPTHLYHWPRCHPMLESTDTRRFTQLAF